MSFIELRLRRAERRARVGIGFTEQVHVPGCKELRKVEALGPFGDTPGVKATLTPAFPEADLECVGEPIQLVDAETAAGPPGW